MSLSNLNEMANASFNRTSYRAFANAPTTTQKTAPAEFTVTLDGTKPDDNTVLIFSVTASAGTFTAKLTSGGQSVEVDYQNGEATTKHFSVECGQNLRQTDWSFELDFVESSVSKGTWVFTKSKVDEDVLI